MSVPNPIELVKQWRRLKSADARERREAISYLRQYIEMDQRLIDQFQKMADHDPDAAVRAEARSALLDQPQPTAPISAPTVIPAPPAGVWTCKFCNTENITAVRCPNCGAERASGKSAVVRPLSVPPPAEVRPPTLKALPFFWEPKSQAFFEGRSKTLAGGCGSPFFVFLAVLQVISAAIFLGVALPTWNKAQDLDQQGIVAEGTIQSRRIYTDSEGSDSYYVTYVFWATRAEQWFTREQLVSSGTYDRLSEGAQVRVKYMADNPSHSKMLGDGKESVGRTIGFLASIGFIVLVVIMFIIAFETNHRHRELIKKGQLVTGEIIQFKSWEDSDNDLNITLRYRFVTPAGREIIKQEKKVANEFKKRPFPSQGTPVVILYHTDKHFKLL